MSRRIFAEEYRKSSPFNPERACLAVLLLSLRRNVKGHHLLSSGTMDTIPVYPRKIFPRGYCDRHPCRDVMHNYQSRESNTSKMGIKLARDLIRAGQLLKMELVAHVVIGNGNRSSLRERGCFYQSPPSVSKTGRESREKSVKLVTS